MLNQRIPQIFTLSPESFIFMHKQQKKHLRMEDAFRDRDRIQTCNRLIRSQLLYSVELRGQSF